MSKGKRKQNPTKKIYTACWIIAGLIVLLMGGFYLFRMDADRVLANNNATLPNAPALDTSASEPSPATPAPQQESVGIAIPGWGTIELPAGQTEVQVDFPNPAENADRFYLSFAVVLKDTGETLYESGLVPPGKAIQSITLSRPLEAGTYASVIHVQPYTMAEPPTPTNNADMETLLVVK